MINREFIDKIEEMSKVEIKEIDDRPYSTKDLFPIMSPTPAAINIHTLSGFADYINSNIDKIDLAEAIVIVADHETAQLFSRLDSLWKNRAGYISATYEGVLFPYENRISSESFIIKLQTLFEKTEDLERLLALAGNVKQGIEENIKDNGISQEMTVKSGAAMVEEVVIPNPFILKPYRTFLEVDQPESPFLFRLHAGPKCALYEADGGKWKLEAVHNIAAWLKGKLPKNLQVIS